MATISFDTMQFVDTLKEAGFDEKQAKALVKAQAEAMAQAHDGNSYATKSDLKELETNLYKALLIQTVAIAGILLAILKFLP